MKSRTCWIRLLIKDCQSNLSSLIILLLVIHVFHQNQNKIFVVTLIRGFQEDKNFIHEGIFVIAKWIGYMQRVA